MALSRVSLTVLVSLGVMVCLFIILNMSNKREYSEEYVKLSELISASIDLARRGGQRVVEVRNMNDEEIGRLTKGKTKEGKDEYVTIGDKVFESDLFGQSEKLQRKCCKQLRLWYAKIVLCTTPITQFRTILGVVIPILCTQATYKFCVMSAATFK